jgi:hypothetical protein
MALCQGRPPLRFSAATPERHANFQKSGLPARGTASSFLAQNKMFSAQAPSAFILGRERELQSPAKVQLWDHPGASEGRERCYNSSLRSQIAKRNCQPSKLITMRPNSSHDTS